MLKIPELVQYVSALLRDQEAGNEFMTWDEQLVENAVRDALSALAQLYPQLFITPHTLLLVPGGVQTLPPGVSHVSVDAQNGGAVPNTFIQQRAPYTVRLWNNQACGLMCEGFSPVKRSCDSTGWKLRYWGWEIGDAGRLFVYPPVPADGRVYTLDMNWLDKLDTGGDVSIGVRWQPALVHYALHMLYAADNESQSHMAKSDSHLKAYQALIAQKGQRQEE